MRFTYYDEVDPAPVDFEKLAESIRRINAENPPVPIALKVGLGKYIQIRQTCAVSGPSSWLSFSGLPIKIDPKLDYYGFEPEYSTRDEGRMAEAMI